MDGLNNPYQNFLDLASDGLQLYGNTETLTQENENLDDEIDGMIEKTAAMDLDNNAPTQEQSNRCEMEKLQFAEKAAEIGKQLFKMNEMKQNESDKFEDEYAAILREIKDELETMSGLRPLHDEMPLQFDFPMEIELQQDLFSNDDNTDEDNGKFFNFNCCEDPFFESLPDDFLE